MAKRSIVARPPAEWIAFAASFVLFALMVAPGVEWMDSGELTAAAYTLGGAHPPGHPAHTLLGKLATLLPIGEIAFRVNLLSAAAMAAAVAGVFALSRALLATELVAAGTAAALVCLSPVSQLNATRAEVYAPVAALIVWAMVATVRFVRSEAADGRLLLGAGLASGFAAAFHPVIAAAAALPMAVALVWHARARLTRLAPPAVALGLLGLFCYAYLPVRANAAATPLLMWGDPSSPGELWRLLTGSAYQGNFAFAGSPDRFAELVLIIGEGMGLTILFGGLLGLAFATISGLRGASLVAASALLVVAGAATQRHYNPDMPGYVLPALLFLAVGLAPITGAVLRLLPRALREDQDQRELLDTGWRHGVAAAVLLPLVALGALSPVVRAKDGGFRRHDDPLHLFSQTVDRMPPGPGIYLADSDPTLFTAQYERFVAGARPDIAIANPELTRDRWFLRLLKRQRPELYVPYIDDDSRGNIAERLARGNVAERPVGGDAPFFARLFARPLGRGFRYGTTPDRTPASPAPGPLDFGGDVGARVAGMLGLRRAELEAAHQRFAEAARAAGLGDRFSSELPQLRSARATPDRPSLYAAVRVAVPARADTFLYAPWQAALLGDDLAWIAGLPAVELGPEAPPERHLHASWRSLLSGQLRPTDPSLQRFGPEVGTHTGRLLLQTGMGQCRRGNAEEARRWWQLATTLESSRRDANLLLQQLHRCKAPSPATPTP